jgi:MFS family permease
VSEVTTGASERDRLPLGANGRSFDRAYATRVMLVLAGLVTVVLYVEGMLTPSLVNIEREFSITPGEASLILSSYIITGVALSPVVGKLGDIYGKKRVLGIVIVLYAACVSVTGFSPSYTFMVAARAFQGIGLTLFPLGMSLVREEFPRDMVPRAQGLLSAMFGAGFAVSLPLGAWVSNSYGWRTTYHTAIPFVVVLAVLVFLVVRESPYRRPDTKVDYVGAALIGASLACFVLALSEGPNWGWLAPATLGLLAVGGLLLVPLVGFELRYHARGGEAILDLGLLRQRNVMVTNILGAVVGLGMYVAMLSMVFLFGGPTSSGGYNMSILGTGISLVPLAIGMLIFAAVGGALVSRVGTRPMTAIGSAVAGIAFLFAIPHQSLTSLLAIEFVIGGGIGIVNAGMINLLVLTVHPREMGLATSLSAVFRNVGSSLGAPLSGSLLTMFTTVVLVQGIPATVPSFVAFQWSFAIAAASFAFAGCFVAFGREVLGKHAVAGRAFETAPGAAPSRPRADRDAPSVGARPSSVAAPR